MANTAPISFPAGVDYSFTVTYQVGGSTLTAITAPKGQVRRAQATTGVLVIDLASYITQPTPGQLVIALPSAVTRTLAPGNYWWDLFGVVNGAEVCVVPVSPWVIPSTVTEV